jgi:hypothetical protein
MVLCNQIYEYQDDQDGEQNYEPYQGRALGCLEMVRRGNESRNGLYKNNQ